jgi:hypothetical protein
MSVIRYHTCSDTATDKNDISKRNIFHHYYLASSDKVIKVPIYASLFMDLGSPFKQTKQYILPLL